MEELKLSKEDLEINKPMVPMVSTYDAYMRKMTIGRERVLRQRTVELAGIKAGDSVLEVGCGTGSLTLTAKKQSGPNSKVFGIDVIPEMIEYSRQKAAQSNLDISFKLGTINDIPFPDNTFDVVMASFMIFHMSEDTRQKGIVEIYRVLKPKGRMLIVDLAMPSHPIQQAIAKRVIFSGGLEHELGELLPLMNRIGFSDLECASVNFSILGLSILAYIRGYANKSDSR